MIDGFQLPVFSYQLSILFAFIFGLIVGSFLNVCVYRLPRQKSIVYPPSHCTSCNTPIRFYDNIPIVSYLILGGKCRACGARISPVYPFVEFLTGSICTLLVLKFGLTVEALFYFLFISALIVITFIDIEHLIIPNVITLPGIVVGLVFGALHTDWGMAAMLSRYSHFGLESALGFLELPIVDSLFGMILGGVMLYLVAFFYEVIRKREGMGMGDVKLIAMIGAFLGWKSVIFVVLISSFAGAIAGVSIMLWKKGNLQYAIPYGPFLSLAAALYVFTGGFRFWSPTL